MGPIVNQSNDPADDALDRRHCGTNASALAGGYQDRCGYGPRLPLLVISPYAKVNYVDHTVTDQASILRFIEDNWSRPDRQLSFDARAGSLNGMFDFQQGQGPPR